ASKTAAASFPPPARASSRCSVETYSSLNCPASSKARFSTSLVARLRNCCPAPDTLGRRSSAERVSASRESTGTPALARRGATTPSFCAASAASRCSGSICCWPSAPASSWASATASWALMVNLSRRTMTYRPFAILAPESLQTKREPGVCTPGSPGNRGLLPVAYRDLDLLRLCLLQFGQLHRQHAVLVLGLHRIQLHRVRQGEGAAEGAVVALHAESILFLEILLVLALAAQSERVVLDADVDVFLQHVRQLRLQNQLMLGLEDVHSGCPGCQRGGDAQAAEDGLFKEAGKLVLKLDQCVHWVPTGDGVHEKSSCIS